MKLFPSVAWIIIVAVEILLWQGSNSFVFQHPQTLSNTRRTTVVWEAVSSSSSSSSSSSAEAATTTTTRTKNDELAVQKKKLLGLVGAAASASTPTTVPPKEVIDPVLADPITKEAVRISVAPSSSSLSSSSSKPPLFGGEQVQFWPITRRRRGKNKKAVQYIIRSSTNTYAGSSDRFLNLLHPISNDTEKQDTTTATEKPASWSVTSLLPPPLRSALAQATVGLPIGVGSDSSDYVLSRDFFTNPILSFIYERGYRQYFPTMGFPGLEKELQMAMDYFEPAVQPSATKVLVDMSCGSGLFTRAFAKSGKYKRVIGCDYSGSMLDEARQRIERDPQISTWSSRDNNNDTETTTTTTTTRLDLVRLDVGQIPMQDSVVDALHAGAAMHCWPNVTAAASEIHRVLKPGGRYFATTVLESWYDQLPKIASPRPQDKGQDVLQTFNKFASVDHLKAVMVEGGFQPDQVSVEVIASYCVAVRCEK